MKNTTFEVENFSYNGLLVTPKRGKAKYKATFVAWTSDPGIAKCICTDGITRLIPSCQLIGDTSSLPKQQKTNTLFGQPANS